MKFGRSLAAVSLFLVLVIPVVQGQQSTTGGDFQVGIRVGEKIPAFLLKGQDGSEYDFNRIKGPNGAALMFFRSADWCPYCKTQLVQLEQALDNYKKQGLGVAAISYDSVAVLKNFSDRMKIRYPLLSDPGSAAIKAFGILNTTVPQTSEQYGIPFPGTYIVDTTGRIVARYFERNLQERFTPDTILTKQFGSGGRKETRIKTEHLTLSVSQTQEKVRSGNRVTLVVDLDLPDRMHVYAPEAQGYRPVSLTIDDNPAIKLHAAEFPKPEILFLKAINERVPVYHGKVRISRDVTFSTRTLGAMEVKATFEYQACDDTICYLPKKVPLSFAFELEAFDSIRVPTELRRPAGQ